MSNPLIGEFLRRRTLNHAASARSAVEHLLTAAHEAGHWFAYAHFGVPVLSAFVDLRANRTYGRVVPTDASGFVEPDEEDQVEFIAALAGPAAMQALYPFVSNKHVTASAGSDVAQLRETLDRMSHDDPDERVAIRTKLTGRTSSLIREYWSTIEALAYELLSRGKLTYVEVERVHAQYGIGFGYRGYDITKDITHRLRRFNRSPDSLARWLIANA
jgi:hypothetical protein